MPSHSHIEGTLNLLRQPEAGHAETEQQVDRLPAHNGVARARTISGRGKPKRAELHAEPAVEDQQREKQVERNLMEQRPCNTQCRIGRSADQQQAVGEPRVRHLRPAPASISSAKHAKRDDQVQRINADDTLAQIRYDHRRLADVAVVRVQYDEAGQHEEELDPGIAEAEYAAQNRMYPNRSVPQSWLPRGTAPPAMRPRRDLPAAW